MHKGQHWVKFLPREKKSSYTISAILPPGKISEFYKDCTEIIHPENARMIIQAAKTLQIDVAGVDVRCRDIRTPISRDLGGILEVNALPDLTHHVFPMVEQLVMWFGYTWNTCVRSNLNINKYSL